MQFEDDDDDDDDRYAELRKQVRMVHIPSGRDRKFSSYIRTLIRNRKDTTRGFGSKIRGLFVIGATDAGKNFLIDQTTRRMRAFQPVVNEFGETVTRFLRVRMPFQCNPKTLLIEVLKAMKIVVNERMSVRALENEMRQQLVERGIHFLWIDEAQHLVRDSPETTQKVQNQIKELLQMDETPVHTIISGVGDALKLRTGDGQNISRSEILRLHELDHVADRGLIDTSIEMITKACGIKIAAEIDDVEFRDRLCHASDRAFGTIIIIIQESCFLAVERGQTEVGRKEFVRIYERRSGCRRSENIFSSPNWRELRVVNAMTDMLPEQSTPLSARKRRA